MFNFLGTLFVGFFGLLGKLLPFKKQEYFVEISETPSSPTQEAKPAPAETKKSAKVESAASPAPGEKATKTKSKKTASKETAPAPTKTEPVTAPVAPAVAPKPQMVTFATTYLTPVSTANRRMPGPSMSSFRDMARQVKVKK